MPVVWVARSSYIPSKSFEIQKESGRWHIYVYIRICTFDREIFKKLKTRKLTRLYQDHSLFHFPDFYFLILLRHYCIIYQTLTAIPPGGIIRYYTFSYLPGQPLWCETSKTVYSAIHMVYYKKKHSILFINRRVPLIFYAYLWHNFVFFSYCNLCAPKYKNNTTTTINIYTYTCAYTIYIYIYKTNLSHWLKLYNHLVYQLHLHIIIKLWRGAVLLQRHHNKMLANLQMIRQFKVRRTKRG